MSEVVRARDYGMQRIEALGETPYLDFALDDGSIVRLPHPHRLGDEALARFEAYQRSDGLDREPAIDADGRAKRDADGTIITRVVSPPRIGGKPAPASAVRLMRAVLGDEDYEKLSAHGLTAGELSRIWQDLAEPDRSEGDDPKD